MLKDRLGLPAFRAARKPMLTAAMRAKRLAFAKKYINWTPSDWEHVVFSDESCFRTIRLARKTVRRSKGSDRYNPMFTVKTVKHPSYVMIWGCFSGSGGRGGLFFLPKSTTMKSDNYIEVLRDHLLPFREILNMQIFMQDGAPCHRQEDNGVPH